MSETYFGTYDSASIFLVKLTFRLLSVLSNSSTEAFILLTVSNTALNHAVYILIIIINFNEPPIVKKYCGLAGKMYI